MHLIAPAYAKLNLALAVTAKRKDGWHDLDSVLVRIDWHDLVGVDCRPGEGRISIQVDGPAASGVPKDETNLAARAGRLLERLSGQRLDLDIWIHKRIPPFSGMGGGSSDAAIVLQLGARQLGLGQDLSEISMEIGADVPVLLRGSAARVQGRGEKVLALPSPRLNLVVVVVGSGSTADAYQAMEASECQAEPRIDAVAEALVNGDSLLGLALGSSLEIGARRAQPELADAIDRLRAEEASLDWHLTGSGGALFALVSSPEAGMAATQHLGAKGYLARFCTTL